MRSGKSNSFCNAPLSAKAISREALSVSRSISLGITTSCLPCGISIFLVLRLQSLPRISIASVCASTTVGTPIAITGTPTVSLVILVRWLPTPAPGEIPVSLICSVQPSLSVLREASASIATTAVGLIRRTMLRIYSPVSMPV